MSIREYSMARDSTRQLSPSFRVREFACKGSDVVLIDDELVVVLQCIREHFGKPVTSSTCSRCSCGICIRTLIMSDALVPFTAAIKV